MVKKYGMIVDITRCNGCYNCFLACRDEFCGNDYPGYSVAQPFSGQFWVKVIEKERGQYPKVKVAYTVIPCMQCEKPSCVDVSSNKAVYQRLDGIVIIDPEKAKGQKQIVNACPYRVIYWNEEKNIPQKCTFCAHLLDQGWKEPRCVESCPTKALVFGDLNDPDSEISRIIATAKGKLEVLHPEYGLMPKVQYIGIPKRFVAGEVVFRDKKDECAAGVKVTLSSKGNADKVTKTDNYGDFEFEGLDADKDYTVSIEHSGYSAKKVKVKTNIDTYLGEILLGKIAVKNK
ncbi:MAG: carboxypeptidase regulatory-like domain-containing protein [Dehalococcoidia bacterium]|nr:carboxypeptidase regulatory-like domain-containing protein [Dehalococcoidia bacterium]